MTTNIAAISLLSGYTSKYKRGIYPFLLFIMGYVGIYILIAALLGAGLFIRTSLSYFLQNSIGFFLGPLLILVGMILADMLKLNRLYKGPILSKLHSRPGSAMYALPMGALLALSFCPATAALFFGLLIPLSLQHGQTILFPVLYGLGAAIPLIIIVIFIVHGNRRIINDKWQKRLPYITGWTLIIIGIIISLQRLYLS
jgi:cytochrome c biogenesis protein CcdA